MSRQTSSSVSSSSGGGGGGESDPRSQLFASQRKTMHPGSLGSRPTAVVPNPLSQFENRTHLTSTLAIKSSASGLKPPANQPPSPVLTSDANAAALSPLLADGGCAVAAGSPSIESLQEELHRRKTHNALLKKAVLQEKEKAAASDLKVKQLSIELHRKNEEQDVLVFNNTRLVRRVEALQEELQQAATQVAPASSNWQWSWIASNTSLPQQPDPLKKAQAEIAALQSELAAKIEENELTHMKVFEERRSVDIRMKEESNAAEASARTIKQLQADVAILRLQLQGEADKSLRLKQLGESLAVQAADATAAAAASEERAMSAEQRLQGVIDDLNMRWLLKWKTKMPLDLPEASSPLDAAPEALFDATPSISARPILVSELRRTFSFFSLFLNAFRDRVSAAAKINDSCIRAHGKVGYGCGTRLLLQCSKEHSKVMESVVGSVSRLLACVAAVMGDLQSQIQHENDLLQSFIESSRSIGSALHKWGTFAHELLVCMLMLLPEAAADPLNGPPSGVYSSSAALRGFNKFHRSIASLSSIADEVGGTALMRSSMRVRSFQIVARAAVDQVLQSWQEFCVHISSFFRSETCSTIVNPSLQLSSSRMISILDDCCSSIEQLKTHAAALFIFASSSSSSLSSSPSISQYLRLTCAAAATSARMFAIASPPRIPHAVAATSLNALARIKTQLVEERSKTAQMQQRVSTAEVQLDFLRQQPVPRSQFAETPSTLYSVAVNNSMPLQVLQLHGSEHSQQIYFTDDVDYDAEQIDVDKDLDHVSENISFRLSPEASRLEPEGNVTFSTPLPDRAYGKGSASSIDSNVQFETELRQHLHDLLHYIDDLERQVISSNASIAILSKPCAACTSRSQSFHDSEGKSDNSRSSSRRGSNTMPCGDSSRRNSSVNQQLYGVSADMTPALLPMSQNQSPVYLSPEHTSIPSHTIVAASLRASTRKSVAIQANGWLEHVGESSIGAGKDALQVVVSVKDSMGRALDSQSLRDRDAVLKQFFSAKIANIQNQADTANSNLGVVIAELSDTRDQLQQAIEETACSRGDAAQYRRLFEDEQLNNNRLKEQVAMLSQQVVLLAEKIQHIDMERKSRRAAAKP